MALNSVFRLIYRSRCRVAAASRDAELGNVLRVARLANTGIRIFP